MHCQGSSVLVTQTDWFGNGLHCFSKTSVVGACFRDYFASLPFGTSWREGKSSPQGSSHVIKRAGTFARIIRTFGGLLGPV